MLNYMWSKNVQCMPKNLIFGGVIGPFFFFFEIHIDLAIFDNGDHEKLLNTNFLSLNFDLMTFLFHT